MPRSRDTRTDIIEAAAKLFDREGFRAVSMDDIATAAGAAKMTVYRHFASKDALIVACLERSNAKYDAWVTRTMGDEDPVRQIELLFEALDAWSGSTTYAGLSFQRVFLELDDPHPAREVASTFAHSLVLRLSDLCQKAGRADADALGNSLYLLMTGAFVTAHQAVPGAPPRYTSHAAKMLLGSAR